MELERLTRKLEGLVKASKQGYKVRNLYEIMRQEDIWLQAYANIYSNKGALTKGIDDNTLDGMSKRRISNLINHLKEGTYKPKPVRRVNIPKQNGKLRPLGIPSGDDKLVQEVIRIITDSDFQSETGGVDFDDLPGGQAQSGTDQQHRTIDTVKDDNPDFLFDIA